MLDSVLCISVYFWCQFLPFQILHDGGVVLLSHKVEVCFSTFWGVTLPEFGAAKVHPLFFLVWVNVKCTVHDIYLRVSVEGNGCGKESRDWM